MSFVCRVPGVAPEEWDLLDSLDRVFASRVLGAVRRLHVAEPAARSFTVRGLPLALEHFGVPLLDGSLLLGEEDGLPVYLCSDRSVGYGGVAVCANVPPFPSVWVYTVPGLEDDQYEVFVQLRGDGMPAHQAFGAARLLLEGSDV